MGEEVAEYQGAYKVTQGLLQEFGAMRVIDTPITEHGFAGLGVGAAHGRAQADRRVHDLQFRHAGDGPADQFGGEDALHVGRPDAAARSCSAGRTGRRRGSPPSTARIITAWYSHIPGLKVIAPYTAADAKGLLKSAIRDPNPIIFLENEILYGQSFPVPKLDDYVVPIGKAKIARSGQRRDHRRLVDRHELCAQGRRRARQGQHQRRGHRPAHAQADGHRDHRRVGEEDRPHRHGRGRLAAVGRRRRDRGQRDRAGLRLARRAGDRASPARTCRCPTRPISRSSRCRRSPRWSRRPRRSATGEDHDEQAVSGVEYPAGRE